MSYEVVAWHGSLVWHYVVTNSDEYEKLGVMSTNTIAECENIMGTARVMAKFLDIQN